MSALVDGHGRAVRYLRLSLTERCNLACVYCAPVDHDALAADWLSDDEVVALSAALAPLGVDHLRLTGGEPTLRPRLPALVARLAALGPRDLALSTNGVHLAALAAPLRRAGLRRVNVSLDTLDAARFAELAGGRAALDDARRGIDAAVDAGLELKLNTVVLDGGNADELPVLARYAWARRAIPRFIELMPLAGGHAPRGRFVPAARIRAILAAAFGPLVEDRGVDGMGPARYLRTAAGERIGIIAAVSEPFCEGCNRIRVSARGRLHACLGLDDPPPVPGDPLDLRAALRRGSEAVRSAVRAALAGKVAGHGFTVAAGALRGGPRRPMLVVGG